MNKYSLSALVAAGLLAGAATSASAADLGGNCCADLEERIAELEATTARKGNRKVSLTVSGWVNQQITFWDDGQESNVYIHDLGSTLGSHVKFTGQATISPGWSAGYVLQIEAINSDGLTTSQSVDNGPVVLNKSGALGVQLFQSYWFVKSDQLGKVSVGLQSQASDNTAILVDGSGSLLSANWVSYDFNSFFIRNSGSGNLTNITFGGAGGCVLGDCNGKPENSIRYDSPTFAGFSLSASWGDDDFWDVAARYSGEFNGIKLAAAAAYSETSSGSGVSTLQAPDTEYFQVGVYVQHVPTGLFVLGNYGQLNGAVETETWYVKAGLRTRWNALGHTVFYGEYLNAQNDTGIAAAVVDADNPLPVGVVENVATTGSEVDVWGLGVVQEIDAAAMSVWLKYRNADASLEGTGISTDDFQYVGVGAIINF